MSDNVGSIHFDLALKTKDFDADVARINSKMQGMGDSFAKIGKAMAIGATVATGAVIAFGVSAVKSFQESELAVTQLNAVLKSTNGIAGVTADMANDLAKSFQKTTRFSDEMVLSAENMLLTFTNIGKDVFPETTEAVLDMATAMGTDLKSTAIQVGKALQDPIEGVTALQRVGVRLTEQQKKQVEAMVKAGKTAEAQKIILKELQTEFGGSAKMAGTTFAGQIDILKNKFDDLKEAVGETLVKSLTPLMAKLSKFVDSDEFKKWLEDVTKWMTDKLPIAIDYITETLLPAFKKIWDDTWPIVKKTGEVLAEVFVWVSDNTWIIWGLVGAFVALKLAMAVNSAVTAFQVAMGLLTGGTIPTVVASLGGMSTAFVGALPVVAVVAGVALIIYQLGRIVDVYYDIQRLQSEIFTEQANLNRNIDNMVTKGKQSMYQIWQIQQSAGYTGNNKLYNKNGVIVGGYATGTDDAPEGWSWVGEQGPELVHLPEHSKVMPSSMSQMFSSMATGIKNTAKLPEMALGKTLSNASYNISASGGGGGTSTNSTVNINGDIKLGDQSAVKEFFGRLNRNNELAQKGLAVA